LRGLTFERVPLAPLASQGHLCGSAAVKLVVRDVRPLTDNERALLEKLASAGQPTELDGDDLILGQTLEPHGLVLFVRNSAAAVITPKGRHALTAIDISMKPVSPKKPPMGFLG
jgi:hypothetical protein